MEVNERALLRRVERLAGQMNEEQQFARLGAAQGRVTAGGFRPSTPRELLQAEQDQSRSRLAAELLKITAERTEDLAGAARDALDAAAIVYPELPPEAPATIEEAANG